MTTIKRWLGSTWFKDTFERVGFAFALSFVSTLTGAKILFSLSTLDAAAVAGGTAALVAVKSILVTLRPGTLSPASLFKAKPRPRQVTLATGKQPARRDRRDLPMARYLTGLPALPAGPIGRLMNLIGATAWGMLGNDTVGDCVWAGAGHETIGWNLEAGTTITITATDALADYSAVTGYNPADPNTDRGTDVRNAYGYRQKTGVVDAAGKRHKLGAYLSVDLDVTHIATALYLFGAVGLGIAFPDSAMTQFNNGQPWDVVKGTPAPTDGHYIPIVGYDPTKALWYVVTWGKLQAMTTAFLLKYADEHYALLSEEMLVNGVSVDGFNDAALRSDLAAINGAAPFPPNPAPTPVPVAGITVTDAALVAKITALAAKDKLTPDDYLDQRLRSLWKVS